MHYKVLLCAGLLSITGASAQTFSHQCAVEDLRLVTAIEEHGEAGSVPAANIAAAISAMLEARATCREGKVADAIGMYRNASLFSTEAAAAPQRAR
jgi:hypothetical protein